MCKLSFKLLRGCQINIFKSPYSFKFLFSLHSFSSWSHKWFLTPKSESILVTQCREPNALVIIVATALSVSLCPMEFRRWEINLAIEKFAYNQHKQHSQLQCKTQVMLNKAVEKKAQKRGRISCIPEMLKNENWSFSYCSGIIRRRNWKSLLCCRCPFQV